MEIPLDIVVESPEGAKSINMKDGLTTFTGIANVVLTITGTIAHKKIPEQRTYKDDNRAEMIDTFSGSYGLNFKIVIDGKAEENLSPLGSKTVAELIGFFLGEALDENTLPLSHKAQLVINDLSDLVPELIAEIRGRMMREAHQMVANHQFNTKIRYKPSSSHIKNLQVLNESTLEAISVKANPTIKIIEASITRFNNLTGNGRLLLKSEIDTYSFGFNAYKSVSSTIKSLISKNLSDNTNINDPEKRINLKIKVKSHERSDGKVIKYMVQEIL